MSVCKTVLFPRLTRERIKTDRILLIDKACSYAASRQARGQGCFDTSSTFLCPYMKNTCGLTRN